MPEVPENYLYTKEHEWIRVEGTTGVIGITDYAQESLGDVVYIELPSVGDTFEAGDVFGTVESVKAVSELYVPLAGKVTEVNEALGDSPEVINENPYDSGWMIKLELADPDSSTDLLSPTEYADYVKEESEG